MVGLFRLGVASNTAGIISKKMFERAPRGLRDPRETLFGTVPFYAPKSVSFITHTWRFGGFHFSLGLLCVVRYGRGGGSARRARARWGGGRKERMGREKGQ